MKVEFFVMILSMLGASIAFIFGVFQYYKTIQLQNFRFYADKYNSILPPEKYEIWVQAVEYEDRSKWDELTPQMIAYLNLEFGKSTICAVVGLYRDRFGEFGKMKLKLF